ncbi:MAG: tetratricopeptide repeat protein [Methylophaga sp.]|nr:tetratricopeptide repeat protein [Methylophaga sp.]
MKTYIRVAIGLALFTVLTGCGSAEESAANFMDSGKALMAEGNTDKARLEFRNVLQIDPSFAPAYYQLALIDEQHKNWRGVYENLSAAEALRPDDVLVLIKLSQLQLLASNYDLANEKIDRALMQQPDNIEALVVKATIALKQQNYGAALATVNSALAKDANSIEAISVRASIYKAQGQYPQAIAELDRALALKPQEMPLIMLKLSVYEASENYTAMEKTLKQLQQDLPQANWVALSYARLLKKLDRDQQGLAVLKQFAEANPTDNDVLFAYIDWLAVLTPEQMLATLDRFIALNDDKAELQFRKVQYLTANAEVEKAKALLEKIIAVDKKSADSLRARNDLAAIAFQQDDLQTAQTLVDEVLLISSEDERALILAAQLLLDSQQVERAVTHLRIVLRNNPQSDRALVLLAKAYAQSGDYELADDNFRQALTVNPGNTIAALSVADSLLKRDELNRAEQVLLTALQKQPEQESLLQALAQVRLLQDDWSGTTELVAKLAERYPETGVTNYLDGRVSEGQGQYVMAVDHYKTALQKQPDLSRALQGLFNSYQQLNDKKALREFLEDFSEQNPEQQSAKVMMADMLIQDGDWQQAHNLIETSIAANPNWLPGYSKLANLYEKNQQFAKAEAAYQRGLTVNPGNPLMAMSLASFYERQQKFAEARSVYEALLLSHPNHDPAINNLASLLTDQFPSQVNFEKALALSKRFTNSKEPYYLDTLAWSRFHLGDLAAAQDLLEQVVEMAPGVPVFHYHLAAVYTKQNNLAAAKTAREITRRLAEQQDDKLLLEQLSKL